MELLLKFTDESESFCNGVEFGRLLEKMQRGDENISNCNFPVKIENKNIIEKSCKEYNYIPIFGNAYFEWIEFIGIKKTFTLN